MLRWIPLVFLLACLAVSARADEDRIVDTGIVCDTPEQIEQFVQAFVKTGDNFVAQSVVNNRAGKPVCARMKVAFYLREEIKHIQTPSGLAIIFRILVVETTFLTEELEEVQPAIQFTLIEAPAEKI